MKLFYNNRQVDILSTLEELGVSDKDEIEVRSNKSGYPKSVLADKSLIPKKSKKFHTSPSYIKMCQMTELELSAVPNFKFWNEHGSVEFTTVTDVRKLDLDEIADIRYKKVIMYPKERFAEESIPELGVELNKPAFLTLKNMRPKKGQTIVDYIKILAM